VTDLLNPVRELLDTMNRDAAESPRVPYPIGGGFYYRREAFELLGHVAKQIRAVASPMSNDRTPGKKGSRQSLGLLYDRT
jgi:hypothetical protein